MDHGDVAVPGPVSGGGAAFVFGKPVKGKSVHPETRDKIRAVLEQPGSEDYF